MSAHVEQLRDEFEHAETTARKIMADKDAALQKIRDRYADRLRAANDKAAAAQKAWLDAEAGHALRLRRDAALEDGDEAGAAEACALAETLKLPMPS